MEQLLLTYVTEKGEETFYLEQMSLIHPTSGEDWRARAVDKKFRGDEFLRQLLNNAFLSAS
jgi:hypothetical protein